MRKSIIIIHMLLLSKLQVREAKSHAPSFRAGTGGRQSDFNVQVSRAQCEPCPHPSFRGEESAKFSFLRSRQGLSQSTGLSGQSVITLRRGLASRPCWKLRQVQE